MKSFRILNLEERSMVILGAAPKQSLHPSMFGVVAVVSEWEHSDADNF